VAGQLEEAGCAFVDLPEGFRIGQGFLCFLQQTGAGAFALDHGQQTGRIALEDEIAGAIVEQLERKIGRSALDGQDHRQLRCQLPEQRHGCGDRQIVQAATEQRRIPRLFTQRPDQFVLPAELARLDDVSATLKRIEQALAVPAIRLDQQHPQDCRVFRTADYPQTTPPGFAPLAPQRLHS